MSSIDLLSGRLPPVEEEIVAVEESLTGRSSDQLAQRRNDFQLHDHSPYCASTSTSPATAAAAATASGSQSLLNYLQMDQSGSSYLTSPQFSHAHKILVGQQQHQQHQHSQSQQQYQQQQQPQLQRQPHINEATFSHTAKVSVTAVTPLHVLTIISS